jgi:hypothetical protein
MVYISDRIREAHPQCGRSCQPNIQAGNQKTIFLPKSGRELEQDPCKFKAGKECFKNGYRTLRDTMVENVLLEGG